MKRFLTLLLLLLGGGSSLWAQAPPTVQWQHRFGNRQNYESAFGVLYTRKHRLVVTGEFILPTTPRYASALWLLSAKGDSLHQNLYSFPLPAGASRPAEQSYGLRVAAEMTNGDLLLAGTRGTAFNGIYYTQEENALLRTDSLGTLKWVRTYPGYTYGPYAIQPLPDNGALLVTHLLHPLSTPNYPIPVPTIIRVDSTGAVVWQRSYGQPYNMLEAITPLADGSYALAGNASTGPPSWQVGGWVLRIDVNGTVLRSRVLGGAEAQFKSVAAAPGGGLVLGGVLDANNALLMVADSLDRPLWQQAVPSPVTNTFPDLTFVRALQQPGRVLVGGTRTLVRYGPSDY